MSIQRYIPQHWMKFEKEWRLRARITHLNKALEGAKQHPNGMTTIVVEGIHRELGYIRAELKRRKTET